MKETILIIACIFAFGSRAQQVLNDSVIELPPMNQQVLDTAVTYGRMI